MSDEIDILRLPLLPTRTIYQPYASAIFSGLKWYETASRRTHIRGRIYIHAASTLPPRIYVPFLQSTANLPDSRQYTLEWLHSLPLGVVLGTVDITDCVPVEEIRSGLSARELAFGDYGGGRWVYKLANPIIYPRAIPAKGKQGWWYFGGEEQLEVRDAGEYGAAGGERGAASSPMHHSSMRPPPRPQHEFKIRIYQMGAVVRELCSESMAEAKREYERRSGLITQYTELVVDGRGLTTGEARKFLKLRRYG